MNHKNPVGFRFLMPVLMGLLLWGCAVNRPPAPTENSLGDEVRADVLRFSREVATTSFTGQKRSIPKNLRRQGEWQATTKIYSAGEVTGEGSGRGKNLAMALKKAAKRAVKPKKMTVEQLASSRFWISLSLNQETPETFIEYHGELKELVGDVVAVRSLSKPLLREKIEAGKHYLLQAMNPELHGFYKRYDAVTCSTDGMVRTIYSASSLYALLKVQDLAPDPKVATAIPLIAEFLLSMQATEGQCRGAFDYSYDVNTQKKSLQYVVGTASKTIFTLLELHRRTQDERYLASAKAAGDWLLQMTGPDGRVTPVMEYRNNQWVQVKQESFLYSGQVLSALSRLYRVTNEKKYYDSADKIAQRIMEQARQQDYYVGDDYRKKNPVSTSWVVMSLLDFYKIDHARPVKEVMLQSMEQLLRRQYRDPANLLKYGRFNGTSTASGNGWINEVMTELYRVGQEEHWPDCEKYRNAVILVTRWLVQNTYSEENTFFLKRPERAFGGLIRNAHEESVRTDAVCHGLNGYLNSYEWLEDGELLPAR